MQIELLFFGQLTDIVGCQKMPMEQVGNIASLKENLYTKFPALRQSKFVIAMNNQLVLDDALIIENAQIAFMPPFSGG